MDLDLFLKRVAKCDESTEPSSKEFVRYVAMAVINEEEKALIDILKTLMVVQDRCDELLPLLEPLFIVFNPKLSSILKLSHAFCEDECDLYIPSNIGAWVVNNLEMFDSEIPFFVSVLNSFEKYIAVDCSFYSKNAFLEPDDESRVSGQTEKEKLKQLYTVVKYADLISDV